jgi:hypothetical protein
MQLRTFMKLSGDLTLDAMLEKMKAVAEPGELGDLSLSSIQRHRDGKIHPGPILQDIYRRASDGAVTPQDWVELAKEVRREKGEAA